MFGKKKYTQQEVDRMIEEAVQKEQNRMCQFERDRSIEERLKACCDMAKEALCLSREANEAAKIFNDMASRGVMTVRAVGGKRGSH